jgi:hypothetical protein
VGPSASIRAVRLGDLEGFGAACAFLCAAQAGFITGQNLTIDGGAYPRVFERERSSLTNAAVAAQPAKSPSLAAGASTPSTVWI